jgi:putative phosphoribosyl transferase
MDARFHDRKEAGQRLATRLESYAGRPDVIVLALPRGGVPVGAEVASAIGAPLDVFVVRKLGVPGQEELAMGAVAGKGIRVLDESIMRASGVTEDQVERITRAEQLELERRDRQYRGDRPAPDVKGKTIILVDDGLATGASMRAAVMALRPQQPARIVVAVPVAAPETCEAFRELADEIICVETPDPFQAVGLWYEDFSQTSDGEVRALLEQHGRNHALR